MKERLYDSFTAGWDRRGLGARRDRQVAALEGEVLEVGAGTGRNLPRYAAAERVVVLEPDRRYARRLAQRVEAARVPVEVMRGSAEALPFGDESFDHVVTTLVLCSVDDLETSMAEVVRVLRPGGSLVFLEHVGGHGRLGRWQERLTPVQRRVADGCRLNRDPLPAMADAGLRIERLERFEMPSGHPLIRGAIQGVAIREGETVG